MSGETVSSTDPTLPPLPETAPAGTSRGHCPPYAKIVSEARSSSSPAQFMQKVLRCTTEFFASPYATLYIRYPSEVLQDEHHVGPTDPKFWKAGLQDFVTDSLGQRRARAKTLKSKAGDTKVAFICAPIFDERGSTVGALALVLEPATNEDLPGRLATLEAIASYASACTEFVGSARKSESPADVNGGTAQRGTSNAALCRAGSAASAEELAFAITNELRNKLGCEQVAIGLAGRKRVRILSISGLDNVNERSPGVAPILAAMEECLDANEPIVYQCRGEWSDGDMISRYRLHKQWHRAAKTDAVASIPLRHADDVVAILSLRNPADRIFTRQQIDSVRSRVEPYAPALLLAQRAGRGLLGHSRDSCRALFHAATTPGRLGRKVLAGVAAALAVWFCFGSLPYRSSVPCVVTAALVRHIAAPMDGVLSSANVVEGDRIKLGDVLCELDRRDIQQQLAKLSAELDVLDRERDWAMAADRPVEVQLAVAKQHLVRAKLDIARRQAKRCVIHAPFDGTVVAGDLRKAIGSSVVKGDPLMEVASLEQWQLELEVPQSSMAGLAVGLGGVFISYAQPEKTHRFEIRRVLSTTVNRDGKSVYLAEASIDAGDDWLRPGMEGVARIHFGSRPVWWIATHGIIDYLRMTFWL